MKHSENKSLITLKIPEDNCDISFNEESITIGKYSIHYYHNQICRERVYADFSNMKYHIEEIKEQGVLSVEIKAVEDIGMVIFFYGAGNYSDPQRIGVLVPCYNIQTGYYNSSLEIIVKEDGKEIFRQDISEIFYDIITYPYETL